MLVYQKVSILYGTNQKDGIPEGLDGSSMIFFSAKRDSENPRLTLDISCQGYSMCIIMRPNASPLIPPEVHTTKNGRDPLYTSLQCPKWLLVQRLNHCSCQNPEILSDRNGFVWKWGTSIRFGGLWFFSRLEQPFRSIGSIPSFLETPDDQMNLGNPQGLYHPWTGTDLSRNLGAVQRWRRPHREHQLVFGERIARSQRVTVNKKEWD